LQRVPGHNHLRRRIGAELQVQSCDGRRRQWIGRGGRIGSGERHAGPDQRRRDRRAAGDARRGQQLAAAEFQV
jgi:hypothetical protein